MWALAMGYPLAKMKTIGLNNHVIGRWSGQASFRNQRNWEPERKCDLSPLENYFLVGLRGTQHWTQWALTVHWDVVWEILNSTEPSMNTQLKGKFSPPGVHGSQCNSKDDTMIVTVKFSSGDFSVSFSGRFLTVSRGYAPFLYGIQ